MPEFNPALDILPVPQRRLWNRMGELAEREFVLYGGTALALHLHHRESVDFDFFTSAAIASVDLSALPAVQPLGPIGRGILGRPGYDAGMDAQP